jgi:alkylation response protein AidB-like acyl-CoA dehydrogenase
LQDYARRRVAFGRPLAAQPLALATLALLELRSCGCLALMLEVACLLGLQEAGAASAEQAALLRLLTPLAKLFTARHAVEVCSQGVEFLGGAAYCEDSHVPVMLRDAQASVGGGCVSPALLVLRYGRAGGRVGTPPIATGCQS